MSGDPLQDLARRKGLLTARAELERMQLSLALHDLRGLVRAPPPQRVRGKRSAMIAAAVVGLGVPLLGRVRLSRVLRGASLALSMWRIVRNWRGAAR
jgi:hypothetical protein